MAANRVHQQRALPRATTSNLPAALAIAAVIVGLSALLPLIQSSDATTTNGRLQELGHQQEEWEIRLHELQVEVATLGGLERIEAEATNRFNLVIPRETFYLPLEHPLPSNHVIPMRFLPSQEQPGDLPQEDSILENFFGWLPIP